MFVHDFRRFAFILELLSQVWKEVDQRSLSSIEENEREAGKISPVLVSAPILLRSIIRS
jgi:hypothetical protein